MCLLSDGTPVLDLTFDKPREGRALLTPRETDWSGWIESLERPPAYVGIWSGPEVCGYAEAPYRIGGWFVEPVESVVGLRPFDDALEGTLEVEEVDEPVPYVLFEVEKILRMMLRQSALALEVLSTPYWLDAEDGSDPCGESRDVVRRALAAEVVEAYRERAVGDADEGASEEELCGAVRQLATCVALGEGRVSAHLDRALEASGAELASDDLRSTVDGLRARLDETAGALPDSPVGYDALDAWLVERRLGRRLDDEPA